MSIKKELVKRYKFVEQVPGWDNKDATDRIHELFHSDEFNETIPLIEDSNHIVNKLHASVPIVAYITARPETVRSGTLKWLARHGFPTAPLIMRPSEVGLSKADPVHRNVWKAQVLITLHPEVIGIVDDNLGLARELTALEYQGLLYLYGPQTETFEESKNVILCPTWQSVLPAVMKNVT